MSKYLKPRRGSQINASSQDILLQKGEIFMEFPEGYIGKEPGRLVIGDGVTNYSDLDYATTVTNVFQPFITDPSIYVPRFENTSTTTGYGNISGAMDSIEKIGNGSSANIIKLPNVIGAIKEALIYHGNSIEKLADLSPLTDEIYYENESDKHEKFKVNALGSTFTGKVSNYDRNNLNDMYGSTYSYYILNHIVGPEYDTFTNLSDSTTYRFSASGSTFSKGENNKYLNVNNSSVNAFSYNEGEYNRSGIIKNSGLDFSARRAGTSTHISTIKVDNSASGEGAYITLSDKRGSDLATSLTIKYNDINNDRLWGEDTRFAQNSLFNTLNSIENYFKVLYKRKQFSPSSGRSLWYYTKSPSDSNYRCADKLTSEIFVVQYGRVISFYIISTTIIALEGYTDKNMYISLYGSLDSSIYWGDLPQQNSFPTLLNINPAAGVVSNSGYFKIAGGALIFIADGTYHENVYDQVTYISATEPNLDNFPT